MSDPVIDAMRAMAESAAPAAGGAPDLSAVGLVKAYGDRTVVSGISMNCSCGEIVGILGPNGAGKTTTIRMVLGETAPTSGLIRVFEQNPIKRSKDIRERIGFIPESPTLYEYMTVGQIGRFAAAFNRKGYLQKYAERCEELGLNEKDRIRTLSKGHTTETYFGDF